MTDIMVSVGLLTFYFACWAFVHSLLADPATKERFRETLGAGVERWYRFAYSAFSVLTLAPMAALLFALPDRSLYVVPAPWRYLMLAIEVAAMIGLALTLLQTGALRFLGLAQILAAQSKESGPLRVRGIYCRVRHPLYLFGLIAIWFLPAMTVNLLTSFVLVTLYLFFGSMHEERQLLAEFGDAYRDYQRQVPRLVPRPGRCYEPPAS